MKSIVNNLAHLSLLKNNLSYRYNVAKSFLSLLSFPIFSIKLQILKYCTAVEDPDEHYFLISKCLNISLDASIGVIEDDITFSIISSI